MTIFDSDKKVPEPGPGDGVHVLARGIASLVPGASELFSSLIIPPLERRRNEWLNDLKEAVDRLESRGIDVETLRDNDAFIDVVLQATQVATRTSRVEKRKALRNALINAAAPGAPDADLQHRFIGFVDELTAVHLQVLQLMQDPRRWFETRGARVPQYAISSSLSRMIADALPGVAPDEIGRTWSDLAARGLIEGSGLQTMMTPEGAFAKRTTRLGDRFVAFIEEPAES